MTSSLRLQLVAIGLFATVLSVLVVPQVRGEKMSKNFPGKLLMRLLDGPLADGS